MQKTIELENVNLKEAHVETPESIWKYWSESLAQNNKAASCFLPRNRALQLTKRLCVPEMNETRVGVPKHQNWGSDCIWKRRQISAVAVDLQFNIVPTFLYQLDGLAFVALHLAASDWKSENDASMTPAACVKMARAAWLGKCLCTM